MFRLSSGHRRAAAVSPAFVTRLISFSLSALSLTCAAAGAQEPAPPPGPLSGSAGAGLALTGGNTDTSNFTASYDVTYDPKSRNIVKSDALYLRAKSGGVLTVSRLNFNARDQYQVSSRVFVYEQVQYLRDAFKAIDYLVAPTAGVGYKLVAEPRTAITVDGGLGAVWEKNTGFDVSSSGALTASERLTQKLSDTAGVTQQVTGLWNTSELGDALYTAGAALAAALTTKSQVKIELVDTYKSRPPTADIKKNDVALVFSIGYKF